LIKSTISNLLELVLQVQAIFGVGVLARLRNLRLLTIEPIDLRRMVCSVNVFLALNEITNVVVVSTKAQNSKALSATVVA
jgi:hypothetical protein